MSGYSSDGRRRVVRMDQHDSPSVEGAKAGLLNSTSALVGVLTLAVLAIGLYALSSIVGGLLIVAVKVVGGILLLCLGAFYFLNYKVGWNPTDEEVANHVPIKQYLLRRYHEHEMSVAKLFKTKAPLSEVGSVELESALRTNYCTMAGIFGGFALLLVVYVIGGAFAPLLGVVSIFFVARGAFSKLGHAVCLSQRSGRLMEPVKKITLRQRGSQALAYFVPLSYIAVIMLHYLHVV